MLKTSYTQDNKELKTWVDPNDGSLNVSIDGKQVTMPQELGNEMISIVSSKQDLFVALKVDERNEWNRFLDNLKVNTTKFKKYATI